MSVLRYLLLALVLTAIPRVFACGNGLPPMPVSPVMYTPPSPPPPPPQMPMYRPGTPTGSSTVSSIPTGPTTLARNTPSGSNLPTPPPSSGYIDIQKTYAASATEPNTCTCGGLAPTDIKWAYSDEEICKDALQRKQAYCIFFCDEHMARLAGEGAQAFQDFKKANAGVMPPITLFEYSLTQNQFTMAGIDLLLKVPDVKEYTQVFQKYDATTPMLLICAPDGERLAQFKGTDCNPITVVGFLNNDFDRKMEAWMQKNRGAEEAAAFRKTQEARRKAAGGVSPVIDARLQNAYHFGPRVITGGYPADEAAFQALQALGVKTIVRVDGEPPVTDRAEQLGMQYLHVPVAYSGIPQDKALLLARIVRDLPGPVYIHCNCGKHRSPAAAATVAVMLGDMSPQQATAAMWVCGASTDYVGLYASAENATKLSPAALDAVPLTLTAKAAVSPMTEAMADIDKSWKHIEALQKEHWKLSANTTPADVENDLKHTIDRFLEANEWEQMKNAPKAEELVSGAQTELAQMLKDWRAGHSTPDDEQHLNVSLLRVQQSCYNCHTEYRNAVSGKK